MNTGYSRKTPKARVVEMIRNGGRIVTAGLGEQLSPIPLTIVGFSATQIIASRGRVEKRGCLIKQPLLGVDWFCLAIRGRNRREPQEWKYIALLRQRRR